MVRPKAAVSKKDELQTETTDLSSRNQSVSVIRRSVRLEKINSPSLNNEIEPIVEINAIGDDANGDDAIGDDIAYGLDNEEKLLPIKKTLEEKLDDIAQAVDELKDKASRSSFQDDDPSNDHDYKNLYFASQLKVEALMKENYELSKKVEVSLAKMEAYGEVTRVWSDVLGKVKDVFILSNLPRKEAAEVETHTAAAKRKKKAKSKQEIAEPNGADEPQTVVKRKKNAKSKLEVAETNGTVEPETVVKRKYIAKSMLENAEPNGTVQPQTVVKRKNNAKSMLEIAEPNGTVQPQTVVKSKKNAKSMQEIAEPIGTVEPQTVVKRKYNAKAKQEIAETMVEPQTVVKRKKKANLSELN